MRLRSGFATVLLMLTISPSSALEMRSDQHQAAHAAFEQRIRCAAYYRYSFKLLEQRPGTLSTAKMMRTYRFVGQNMLVQASAMASTVGADKATLTRRFESALAKLDAKVHGNPQRYNSVAARLHGRCLALVVNE